jgi:hypothetical protein
MDEPRRRNLITSLSVAAVAAAALIATWATLRPSAEDDRMRPAHPLEAPVVKAPPITAPDTSVAGGPPTADCPQCGVVEAVAVTQNHRAFQVRVRMSDGSVRTLEQATPVVAGSRVVVQGGVAKPAPNAQSQG